MLPDNDLNMNSFLTQSADAQDCLSTQFCQAARQLSTVPSSKLCVKIASGGDPTYAFNVRLTGEEVHGTSKCCIYQSVKFQRNQNQACDFSGFSLIFITNLPLPQNLLWRREVTTKEKKKRPVLCPNL